MFQQSALKYWLQEDTVFRNLDFSLEKHKARTKVRVPKSPLIGIGTLVPTVRVQKSKFYEVRVPKSPLIGIGTLVPTVRMQKSKFYEVRVPKKPLNLMALIL